MNVRRSSGLDAVARDAAPSEPSAPLSEELTALKRALRTSDVDLLEKLLAPEGVECGDYLYGRAEYDALVRRPDGALRPWLFGAADGRKPSARTFVESSTPVIRSESPGHRSAECVRPEGSLYIGFSLRGDRWLIAEGLFCL